MVRLKLFIILLFILIAFSACFDSKPRRFVIEESKSYEASLFRQHCAICHGPEGEGKRLSDGTVVPSLREGEFKMNTEAEIHKQIADGGNGMLSFRKALTEREINLMTDFVYHQLRGN